MGQQLDGGIRRGGTAADPARARPRREGAPTACDAPTTGAELTPAAQRVAICVATYLRPHGLERLLEHMDALELQDRAKLEIIVVDNDPAGSAAEVVEAYRCHGRFPIEYDIEAVPGIPSVRNRLVALALVSNPDIIGFLDDDEAPRSDWALKLLDALDQGRADVVIGPSEPVFEIPPPTWIVDGKFFDGTKRRPKLKVPTLWARTSGVLIRADAVALAGEAPFDSSLHLSGGSDRIFFTKLQRAGRRFQWVPDAIVTEYVPASRMTRRWVLRRAYRSGIDAGMSFVLRHDDPGTIRRLRFVARNLAKIGVSLGRLLVHPRQGPGQRVRIANKAASSCGAICGLFGVRYREYRTIHGASAQPSPNEDRRLATDPRRMRPARFDLRRRPPDGG